MFSVPSSLPGEPLLTTVGKELGYYGLGLCGETRPPNNPSGEARPVIPASRTCPVHVCRAKKTLISPWPLITAPTSQSSRWDATREAPLRTRLLVKPVNQVVMST
ncbi:hypothetical protein L211DRAFT_838040 [Terfezia boudieri ATCC MYA-4762]|uniref:Uncharacterized protein n=1 Tax=Terfezia boudieri ATCC MYA-4762 TaxID=1051890 RepID=A0A3N4LMH7_9PEZI|nr:hypothetical protein L211DRAFT_838040 [Terfezia boudieri ATCC MYA-4762]